MNIEKELLLSLKEDLDNTNIVDISKKIEALSIEDICDFFYIIGSEIASEIFAYLEFETKEKIILNMNKSFIYELIEYSYTDDIKEFLDECSEEIKRKVLSSASLYRRRKLIMQLNFEEYSAGSLMSIDFVEISENDTAYLAMEKIKSQEKIAETISYCYITNEQDVLIGIVSMRDILLAPEDKLIKDIMETDIISVNVKDNQEFVAQQFSKYDLLIMPVVNDQHQILGIITIDDVLDIIEDEITEDIQKMGGISPTDDDKEYLEMSAFAISKSRIFWLLILMISATISGYIISYNTDITVKLPSLIMFMPMLMDTAGNAGSQSSAMIIRGIIVDNLQINDFFKIFKKEFINSIFLGIILFTVNILRIIFFVPSVSWKIGLLVSITIYLIIIIANLIGGLLPLLALKLKFDPASMSGPVLTTVCDAISLSIYFGLASLYLGGVF